MVEDHLTSTIDGNGSSSNVFHSPPIKNLIYGVLTKLLYLIKSAIQIMHGCESQKSNYALGLITLAHDLRFHTLIYDSVSMFHIILRYEMR